MSGVWSGELQRASPAYSHRSGGVLVDGQTFWGRYGARRSGGEVEQGRGRRWVKTRGALVPSRCGGAVRMEGSIISGGDRRWQVPWGWIITKGVIVDTVSCWRETPEPALEADTSGRSLQTGSLVRLGSLPSQVSGAEEDRAPVTIKSMTEQLYSSTNWYSNGTILIVYHRFNQLLHTQQGLSRAFRRTANMICRTCSMGSFEH